MVNGLWCEDPSSIKGEMFRHYKTLFSEGGLIRPIFCSKRVEKISQEDVSWMEKDFSEGEILDSVQGCRGGLERPWEYQEGDDTIFFGEWNKENAKSLMCILKCFEEVYGLRVNYNKNKLYGVGVNEVELRDMARWMRCGVSEFPFTYLGLPIGENMRMVGAWNTMMEKVKN
ncbi:hypothetical protein Tco_1330920, partial [Tanacetum coccineum]